jgi:hypothetical protein
MPNSDEEEVVEDVTISSLKPADFELNCGCMPRDEFFARNKTFPPRYDTAKLERGAPQSHQKHEPRDRHVLDVLTPH